MKGNLNIVAARRVRKHQPRRDVQPIVEPGKPLPTPQPKPIKTPQKVPA